MRKALDGEDMRDQTRVAMQKAMDAFARTMGALEGRGGGVPFMGPDSGAGSEPDESGGANGAVGRAGGIGRTDGR